MPPQSQERPRVLDDQVRLTLRRLLKDTVIQRDFYNGREVSEAKQMPALDA